MTVLPKVLNLNVLPFIILASIIKMIGIWSLVWVCVCVFVWVWVCVCVSTCTSLILLSKKVEMLIIKWLCSHLGINFIYQPAYCVRSSGRALLAVTTWGSVHTTESYLITTFYTLVFCICHILINVFCFVHELGTIVISYKHGKG